MIYRIIAIFACTLCPFHSILLADISTVEVKLNSFELLVELPNPGIRTSPPFDSEFCTRLNFTIVKPKEKEGKEVDLLISLTVNDPPETQKLKIEKAYWKKRVGKIYRIPERLHKAALYSPFRSRLYIDKDSLFEVEDYANKVVEAIRDSRRVFPIQPLLAATLASL